MEKPARVSYPVAMFTKRDYAQAQAVMCRTNDTDLHGFQPHGKREDNGMRYKYKAVITTSLTGRGDVGDITDYLDVAQPGWRGERIWFLSNGHHDDGGSASSHATASPTE